MLLVGIVIALLPGCFGRKERMQDVEVEGDVRSSSGYRKADQKSLFDEDVEGFVLEEGFDPFTGNNEEDGSVMLVDAGHDSSASTDTSLPDARTSQATYGFKNIYFDFDKDDLRDDQHEMLDHDVRAVKNALNKGMDVVVEGHADRAAGSKHYNMHLSVERAENVKRYCVEHGVPVQRLKVVGRGSEMPIVPTGTIEQQAPNRRVELYVVKTQEN